MNIEALSENVREGSFPSRQMNYALWIVQGLLALIFLSAGGMKLLVSNDVLASLVPPNSVALPGWFLRFIGVAEVLGAIGLILPGLLRIRTALTPLAAGGLVIIMIGATVLTIMTGGIVVALRNSALKVLAGLGDGPLPLAGVACATAPSALPLIGTPFLMSGGGCGSSISSISSLRFGGFAFSRSAASLKFSGGP